MIEYLFNFIVNGIIAIIFSLVMGFIVLKSLQLFGYILDKILFEEVK